MSEFSVPYENNEKLKILVNRIKNDVELNTLWKASNIIAIDRLGYNDHGPVHVKIVANLALRMLRILINKGIVPGVVKNYGMKNEDAEIIVTLASALHDIGHAIHRTEHEDNSLVLAVPIIDRLLEGIYEEEEKTIIKAETLHAIFSHRANIIPLTIEAGIVKIADALDMEEGRARIPFKIGKINIHSVSALAIKEVSVMEGDKKPLKIRIKMRNSAGIFQVDELLKNKIETSGIKDLIEVIAEVVGQEEEKIVDRVEF
ncbi:HD domain-containing protein [Candidatus Aciduliprofundum boonei]|uniref:Metal dependent phosphohydrolase n=1 Tax=Aciduliprofundum boonei (strain DSM 19572 / T469) TaxID=439481 RepID=B5IDN1_ACIB4|nr:HD domain-containing protein [Candidatus Aciduliprofundum boonei]ADD08103.1 metal dependent phosphohydrolase [Aciduliprofundum boonei T469]EDY35634.1 HD domain protein [Aciduliprofundum boonei T469]HII55059.1 HD domain-containing protein [Candidatus Aciduliprofundum boonei]